MIELTAVDDDEPETEEQFVVTLQTPTNGATLGSQSRAEVIIQPSDSPFGLFQIYPAGTRLGAPAFTACNPLFALKSATRPPRWPSG